MAKIALASVSAAAMVGASIATGGLADVLWLTSIGLSVGAALIPDRPPGQAPLQDLNVSSSANGAPIPFGYGTMRLAGQVIWSPGITYRTEALQSGKGAPTPSGYVYFASFAAAFGEGPSSIGRVWADSKLIYKGGATFGSFAPWTANASYLPEDLVSYHWNPGTGFLVSIFQCVVPNSGISPPGNSLYWATAPYAFYDNSVQYEAGNEVAYPGKPTDSTPGSGQIYACIKASQGNHPDVSPAYFEPLAAYYTPPTIYPGDELQAPDPLIQGVQGIANTPAFRGITYAVWEQLPLANFGNRIPNLRAEITFG